MHVVALTTALSKPWLWLWIRLRLAWLRGCFANCACFCIYALRASDARTEPETESKAEALVSKRALNRDEAINVSIY